MLIVSQKTTYFNFTDIVHFCKCIYFYFRNSRIFQKHKALGSLYYEMKIKQYKTSLVPTFCHFQLIVALHYAFKSLLKQGIKKDKICFPGILYRNLLKVNLLSAAFLSLLPLPHR